MPRLSADEASSLRAGATTTEDFRLGRTNPGGGCCGKPEGCTSEADACRYMGHPWKRAMVFGDTTAPCQCTCIRPHPETGVSVHMRCVLLNRHDGECDPQP